jgi:hypothetical protein
VPHAKERVRPGIVRIEGERPIDQRLALPGVAVEIRAQGVFQLGQLTERDRQLEMGIDEARIARQRCLGIGGGLLDQGLLAGIRA